MENLRQSGRTSRMLAEAKKLSVDRRAVYIIAASNRDAQTLQALVPESETGVKVETAESLRTFDWETMRLCGAHSNCVVLVDHFAIESRFVKMLEMLHRFDLKTRGMEESQ